MKLPLHYVVEKRQVKEATLAEWAAMIECCDRHVAETLIGTVRISTVFIGLDHRWLTPGPPLVFETMIFGDENLIGELDQSQCRYCTVDEAERGHRIMVERVREFLPDTEATIEPHELMAILPGRDGKYADIMAEIQRKQWESGE